MSAELFIFIALVAYTLIGFLLILWAVSANQVGSPAGSYKPKPTFHRLPASLENRPPLN